jgi:PAS domain S-box-containing protein
MWRLPIKRNKGVHSLATILAFAFFAVSGLVLFIFSGLSTYSSFQNQRRVIDIQQQLIAEKAADAVKGFFDERVNEMASAIYFEEMHKASPRGRRLALEKLLGREPSFRQLILFDARQKEVLHISRLSRIASGRLTDQTREELFSQVRQDKRYISPVYIDRITSEPMVIVALPLADVFGDLHGALAAEVNLKFMWDLMDHIKIGRNGYAYVVDMEGYLIAFGDIGRVLKREKLSHLKEVDEFIGGNESIHVSRAEISKGILGTSVLTTHVHLGGNPDWAVVVELPILEAYETILISVAFSIVAMILSFALAIIIGTFLAKKITRPIIALRDATQRVGTGRFDATIEARSKDEIGELATSFNQMIEDLKKVTVSRDALAKEIKRRKRMEEKLRLSEERYRSLIETMKVGLTSIDEKGVLTYANEQFCRMLGYSMDEVIGRSTVDFYYDEETRKAQKEVFAKRKKGLQDPTPYEITWARKDRQKVHTILTPTPSFDANGHYTGSFAIITDITERKRMEEQLQKSEALYRTLIETTKVGVTAINENGVITYANDRLCEIWGYPLNEIMRRRISEFLDEKNLKIFQEQLAKRKEGGRDSYEIAWKRKDGKNVPTILAPTPIFDAYGHFKGSYGFLTDITERKQAQERLQRYAAELERSNEEVKNFAYIVSHDLRVPLVNLKGYTAELRSALEVIAPNMGTALPHLTEEKRSAVAMALHEDVPEALEFITTSVSRMDSFINAVLQLSRLGRRELKSEPIDMNSLIQTTVETLAHQIQERGIKVTVGSMPQVVADRTSMEQIMGNVLGNAVKYLDPDHPGQIEVTAETNNGEQFFRIQDNGRGIAKEDMHKVFAPFRRAGKQDTPGEGMGLAYVQTLVRRHGGRIWCESELGAGTTFTFTISQQRAEGGDYVKGR